MAQIAFLKLNDLNLPATALARRDDVQNAMQDADWISISISRGRAETNLRRTGKGWEHRTCYVDRCFGVINQKWQPLKEAA